mmetsp:Transcript_16329/g.20700  ORF Transcript_16329/g.20700 Transcript_16329/m.20700 type:complete len:134 (-) Transcript_16329:640-1041(-)
MPSPERGPSMACLDVTKRDLQTLKALNSPPRDIAVVFQAVAIILGQKQTDWGSCKKLIAIPDNFLATIRDYDIDNAPFSLLKKLDPIVGGEGFTPENIVKKSACAASLCEWVISLYCYIRDRSEGIAVTNEPV